MPNETESYKISKMRQCFSHAKRRCNNPRETWYHIYGGRGIKFLFCSFDEFYDALSASWFDGASLDRIDTDGHYEVSNVRWATMQQQQRNRRNNVYVTHKGVTKLLVEWAEVTGIGYFTLTQRLLRGWPIDIALTKNVQKRCNRRFLSAD